MLMVGAVGGSPRAGAGQALKVVNVDFERQLTGGNGRSSTILTFTLKGFRTQPQSQLIVTLSRPPKEGEEVLLQVWLVDSAGSRRQKVYARGQDTVQAWELPAGDREVIDNVSWEILRPSVFERRGVYRLLVTIAPGGKRGMSSARFVLENGSVRP